MWTLCVMNDSKLNSQLCATLYSEATRHKDQILYIRHMECGVCVGGGGGGGITATMFYTMETCCLTVCVQLCLLHLVLGIRLTALLKEFLYLRQISILGCS